MTALRYHAASLLIVFAVTGCVGSSQGADTNSSDRATGPPPQANNTQTGPRSDDNHDSEDTSETTKRPRSLDLPAAENPTFELPERNSAETFDFPGIQSELIQVDNRCEIEITVTNEAIRFPYDSAEITHQGRRALQAIAKELAGTSKVRIVGHTSTEGDTAHNQGLSERRAAAVAAVLEELLDPTPTLDRAGRGELEPLVYPDNTEAKREANRRVVITAEIEQTQCDE